MSDFYHILWLGIEYKPPEYKEHKFVEAPKFTTNMPDRSTTVGYSTKLLCAVRGFPKASWLISFLFLDLGSYCWLEIHLK